MRPALRAVRGREVALVSGRVSAALGRAVDEGEMLRGGGAAASLAGHRGSGAGCGRRGLQPGEGSGWGQRAAVRAGGDWGYADGGVGLSVSRQVRSLVQTFPRTADR